MSVGGGERVRVVTPLGVWLWDSVSDAPILDPLRVVAVPLDGPGPERAAVMTPSGVRAFAGMAGLHRFEYPLGDEDPWAPSLETASFAVTVDDPAGRFNRATIVLEAPEAGLAGPGSPPGGPIYLFSAPERRFPPAVAVVRADLADVVSGEPAAHARLDVIVAGRRWAGIASETGAVAVGFPYPAFGGAPPPSPPPGTGGTPPSLQVWPVSVEVRHAPEALEFPLPGGPAPDLASILGQPPVAVWPDSGGQPSDALDADLRFGADLVLRTGGGSSLLIGGTSP